MKPDEGGRVPKTVAGLIIPDLNEGNLVCIGAARTLSIIYLSVKLMTFNLYGLAWPLIGRTSSKVEANQ
jgi:hypothetical protein